MEIIHVIIAALIFNFLIHNKSGEVVIYSRSTSMNEASCCGVNYTVVYNKWIWQGI